jgi:hypothetical protein
MPHLQRTLAIAVVVVVCVLTPSRSLPADHNDPNAVNSIFSDVPQDAADLYDLFGFPVDDGRRVVLALTFAAVPRAGVFDADMLYRILLAPNPRVAPPLAGDRTLQGLLGYFDAVKSKYLGLKPFEVRVRFETPTRAKVDFLDFPGGAMAKVVDVDAAQSLTAPDGSDVKIFIGGRDDAFFNDLPGFFRSINYAPQFYKVPHTMMEARELKIPKTLIELEGNTLFNFNPENPLHGQGVKTDLPPASQLTWTGNKYKKDERGHYRFVYSGKDAQAGRNINAIIVELPLAYLTKSPATDRIVNAWGESWVRTASGKIDTIPPEGAMLPGSFWLERARPIGGILIVIGVVWLLYGTMGGAPSRRPRRAVHVIAGVVLAAAGIGLALLYEVRPGQQAELARASQADELKAFKLVDTDGQPFADAGLNERENSRQVGPNNFVLGPHFVRRLAHLGWGFGPSVTALGLRGSFDHDNSPISVYRTYDTAAEAFPRVAKMLFQPMTMPDESWHAHKDVNIPVRRAFEVFVPNVAAIDMDTNGSWPYGRRLEDQVATRFLSIFLDMEPDAQGRRYNIETLADQAALDTLPMEPKVPPNPLKNDKAFLAAFPYLAEPWPSDYTPGPR